MCIIAIKPPHHKMIDESIIETMFQNNPDGSGYMYSYNNKVHIEKGFMTLKELLNSLDSLKKKVNIEEIPLILHFRISTSGKTDGATCHPFPITSDLNALRKTHVITNLGMAHNGVIYDFEEKKSIIPL
jgi:predicted glutamine amidotransferase